jgi:tricorn protease
MRTNKILLTLTVMMFCAVILSNNAIGSDLIHGMRFPELSPDGSTLVFSYQGDLWSVNSSGGMASRLTAHDAYEGLSRFSPDGLWIAFQSNRISNGNIFIMPAGGSNNPERITLTSQQQILSDWYPDGSSLLITSPANPFSYNMCKKDLVAGVAIPFFEDLHDHNYPVITSDASTIYYIRTPAWDSYTRTGYRGSADGDIWAYDIKTGTNRVILDDRKCQHFLRLGHDETYLIYVDYENQGSANLTRLDLSTKKITQLTFYNDDIVRNPSIDSRGNIVYEYMNDLWRLEPSGKPSKLAISASAEDKRNTKELKSLSECESADISPDDKLAVVGMEGDIFAFRTDGEVDNRGVTLTDTSGALDSEPVFSKDGKSVFFLSNSGEGSLLIRKDLKTLESETLITEPTVMHNLQRVPKTDLLSFIRDSGDIVIFNPEDKSTDQIAHKLCFVCEWVYPMYWSPDGKYLALDDSSGYADEIFIVDRETKEEWNLSHYVRSDSNPIFSPDGRWLMYSTMMDDGVDIKLVELNPKTKLDKTVLIEPEEKKPEEPEKVTAEAEKTEAVEGEEAEKPADEAAEKTEEKEELKVVINFDRIDERARIVNITRGYNDVLGFSLDGEWLYYSNYERVPGAPPIASLWKVPTDKESKEIPQKIGQAPDRLIYSESAIYAFSKGRIFNFTDAGMGEELPFVVERNVDQIEETKLAMKLAWLYLKESFYDENLHGADWKRIREKYLSMIDDARTPTDVVALINRLNGELDASHLAGYGPTKPEGQMDDTACIGLEWDPFYPGEGLKIRRVFKDGPADKPDIEIKPGDIVLKIEGIDVDLRHDPAPIVNHKAGEVITLTVKGETENREVKIKAEPSSALYNGLYNTWVDENRKRVDKLSNNRLGYCHIEWMGQRSLEKFTREYMNLTKEKEGVIIDIRFNPGGNISEQLLDILDRRIFGFATERGWSSFLPQPITYNRTPSVLLINESSYSDAEIFPYAYKQLGLGKLIGMKTFGAVIGTSYAGLPGGYGLRIPCEGWFKMDLVNMEHYGVDPDIEVPWPPDAIGKDEDPQIERAVKELLDQLDK